MTRRIAMLALLTLACGRREAEVASPVDESAVTREVVARVHDYGTTLGPALCQRPEPYYDFWTYDHGGIVLAENGTITQLDSAAHRTQSRSWFCRVTEQSLVVDTVVVQVLGANTAVATWTFREEVTDTLGVRSRIRGDVMQPWIRRDGAWRSTGLVATHEVTAVPTK